MPLVRFHDALDDIEAAAWDGLVGDTNPFVRHAFLAGLEHAGCIRAGWGWKAHHLTLHEGDRLVGACPLYLKTNSHGEYVFDWAWADAWERAGGRYYPKLLCAVPYSPVPGPRLLAPTPALRALLAKAIVEETRRLGLSSAHIDFLAEGDLDAFGSPWLARFDWQYHWHNRDYADFEDFLGSLRHKKRKNIRNERDQVRHAGIECHMQRGDSLDETDWHTVHALYRNTFDSKGNYPTLTLRFFRHLAATFGDGLQLALARRNGQILAMAIFLCDGRTLYGRYWGTREHVPALHFELCYYQGIEYAIRNRLARFNPGAQGMHKLARGFVPERTHSRHFIANPAFREAVAAALEDEARLQGRIGRQLDSHSPYRCP